MRRHVCPVLLTLAVTCSALPLGAAEPPARKPPVQLSSPYERMRHEQIANGRVLPQALIERFGLDLVDEGKRWFAEVGYNQWVWGRSARRYKEPFLAIGRKF